MRAIDRTGNQYGKLKVLSCTRVTNGTDGGEWKCQCECGNIATKKGVNLASGSTSSCGCIGKSNFSSSNTRRKYHETTLNYEYTSHVKSAKNRNLIYLKRDVWLSFIRLPCNYCGSIDVHTFMDRYLKAKRLAKHFTSEEIKKYEVSMNGIDRIDSSLGYIVSNCVSCCKRCNYMKNSLSLEAFIAHVNKINQYFNKFPKFYDRTIVNPDIYQQRTINRLFHTHKNKKESLDYLDMDIWKNIVFKPCHYCGGFDEKKTRSRSVIETETKTNRSHVFMNGVDRIDSSLGYTINNSVPCCYRCNWMKTDLPIEQFVIHIEAIYQYQAR